MKSLDGCWTCRVRRKRCDRGHPVCDACAALRITCYNNSSRPEWMDGGVKQDEMAKQLKREVRNSAPRRGQERAVHMLRLRTLPTEAGDEVVESPDLPIDEACPRSAPSQGRSYAQGNGTISCTGSSLKHVTSQTKCVRGGPDNHETIALDEPDTTLLIFYLDNLFPFLFPFYQPDPLQGGRAWVLKMIMSSPMLRQVTLCQSSFFFSLAQGTAELNWENVLTQTGNAFGTLKHALSIVNDSSIMEHLHGAIRILTGIVQLQRFETAILSFDNCQAHLTAAVAVFQQLLTSFGGPEARPSSRFNALINFLESPSWTFPTHSVRLPSTEQAAFRFSSALLVFDDIIASTILQEQPRLYEYHKDLLSNNDGAESTEGNPAALDFASVVGCQNWVLVIIGEIAALDAWKQQRKRAGNLDVEELVQRAAATKESSKARSKSLTTDSFTASEKSQRTPDILMPNHFHRERTCTDQSVVATRIWTHAASIYLFVVVSGWQPTSPHVHSHVRRILELLTDHISSPALLRTMVWPFCVAGCFAEPGQEAHLRSMVEALQPQGFFGTIGKGLHIMENVWRNRETGDNASRDLASCFRYQDDLALLI